MMEIVFEQQKRAFATGYREDYGSETVAYSELKLIM